jgi:hypothetical protein
LACGPWPAIRKRGLDVLGVEDTVVIQQDAMGGAGQQVATVGQAAVRTDRGQQ